MRSDAAAADLLRSIVLSEPGYEVVVSLDEASVRATLRQAAPPHRVAEVIRSGLTQYSVLLDGAYLRSWVDEDLTPAEEVEHFVELTSIASAYTKNGAELRHSRLLRSPYLVLHRDGGEVPVYRIPGKARRT